MRKEKKMRNKIIFRIIIIIKRLVPWNYIEPVQYL